jgi:hypothetical protein
MHIDNYDIRTICELFQPYIEKYSRRINGELYLQEVNIIPRKHMVFTYESYNDDKLHICEIDAVYGNDRWTIKKIIFPKIMV